MKTRTGNAQFAEASATAVSVVSNEAGRRLALYTEKFVPFLTPLSLTM